MIRLTLLSLAALGLTALLRWGKPQKQPRRHCDPLLALYNSGRHIWARGHADDYVRRLRAG